MLADRGDGSPVLADLALGGDGPTALYRRGDGTPDGHGGLTLDPGGRLDLGTWFNAAPVGWWRHLLGIATVRLVVAGSGELTVHSAGPGAGGIVRRARLAGEQVYDLPVPDGARWYWLELAAVDGPARLDVARWTVPDPATAEVGGSAGRVRVTVVVPTFGRERDAIDQVRRLLAPGLADAVARVVLVDQARTVRRAPGASEAIAAAGDRLLLVEQDNLGGSGGYARGMLESLAWPDDAVLLLDDDARIEPDGLRRMLAISVLARAAGRPTVVGTPLLSAEQPTHLEALAEGVRGRDFRWGPTDRIGDGADVSVTAPDGWSFADPDAPVDYSGWWGTLLPPGAVADLGLPVPYFLKWDDAEYGLRARRAGYRVATMPGTGVWHPTWAAKGTISSWAAWPLHRNRLTTAAAYGARRGVLLDSLVHQVKHLLSLQYQTADLWDAALAQFQSGPEWLDVSLRSTRSRAQELLAADPDPGDRPSGAPADAPAGTLALARRAGWAVTGLVRRNDLSRAVRCAPAEFTWRTGIGRDAVLLEGSDRALIRDPARARAALWRTVRLHARTALRWSALRRRYGAALPASRTERRWRATIG